MTWNELFKIIPKEKLDLEIDLSIILTVQYKDKEIDNYSIDFDSIEISKSRDVILNCSSGVDIVDEIQDDIYAIENDEDEDEDEDFDS